MDFRKEFKILKTAFEKAYPTITLRKEIGIEFGFGLHGSFDPDSLTIVYSKQVRTWYKRLTVVAHEIGHVIDFYDNHNGDADSLLSNTLLAEQRAYDYGWEFLIKTLSDTGVKHSDWVEDSYKNSVIAKDRRKREAEEYLMKKNLKGLMKGVTNDTEKEIKNRQEEAHRC